MADLILVSQNIAMSMLSISDILRLSKPDLLFLQEVNFSTQTLCDRVDMLGYDGECNIDLIHPTLPGTAIVWKKTLKISEVNQLIERRVMSVKCCGENFLNIYAPSGTANKRERWEMFNELAVLLLAMDKLPVMLGDWNCVLAELDTTNNFRAKYCKVLKRIIQTLGYEDCFRLLYPQAQEFTFHRGPHMAQSRLDRVYIPPHIVNSLLAVRHAPGLSDHCQVEVELAISAGHSSSGPRIRKSYWKLNASLLNDPDFQPKFRLLYDELRTLIGEYDDHAEWWDVLAKPAIAKFCKDFSSKLAKERKSTKIFLYAALKIFLRYENWVEVARTKERIRKMLMYDMTGLQIRSRYNEHAEEEIGSLYHCAREKKKTGSNHLTKMRFINAAGEEEVTEDIDKIAELTTSFYDALFNGRHDKDLHDTGQAFIPSDRHLEEFLGGLSPLGDEAKVKLIRNVTKEEIESVVKSCPNGKSPGVDGLPYELYKRTWDMIGDEFVEVVKDQLRNFVLIPSGRRGATVLPSKVEGIPDVTELRPITLLCCDYQITSKTLNERLNPVMVDVIEANQLATGEKEKNILTGAYDIISAIDFVNKNKKSAYIASYDMVKAYDRAMISFLLKVMERMGFPEVFRRWIKMMHHEATTCLVLPNGLSRSIMVTFSFRQGDSLAMNLYILQQEPLLRTLRATLTGLLITNFRLKDSSYCDDVETLSSEVEDLVKFDKVMKKFEETSGAILSRTKKSKVMGLGSLKAKHDWPQEVRWIKTVSEMKIFGFTICQTYKETVTKTWDRVVRGFEQVLFSWESRHLETLSQRVQVVKTFALSKLYYVAQVLPLPSVHKRRVESRLSSFIFRGRHERLSLSELENDCEKGGLGLPNISVKADALLIRQMCRIINQPEEGSFRMLGYWLGGELRDTGFHDNFPELSDLGPVSLVMSKSFPLHEYMLNTFREAVGRDEVKRDNGPVANPAQHDAVLLIGRQAAQLAGRVDAWDQQQNAAQGVPVAPPPRKLLKPVTTKAIYNSRMADLLLPPKVELKFPLVNFPEVVYSRMNHKVLENRQRDVSFSVIHGLYKNRERLFQQGRADNGFCQNKACKHSDIVETVEHVFCLCFTVRIAWLWVRAKVIELLSDQGPVPVVSNIELLMLMYPKCRKEAEVVFLLGTFLELVHREVSGKQKELMVGTVRGVLKAKVEQMTRRLVPDIHFPLGWF